MIRLFGSKRRFLSSAGLEPCWNVVMRNDFQCTRSKLGHIVFQFGCLLGSKRLTFWCVAEGRNEGILIGVLRGGNEHELDIADSVRLVS